MVEDIRKRHQEIMKITVYGGWCTGGWITENDDVGKKRDDDKSGKKIVMMRVGRREAKKKR